MRKFIKTILLLSVLYGTVLFVPICSYSASEPILEFEGNDTLEELRYKIANNGYNFTVDNNWVYNMPAEMKESFLSRYPPLFLKDPGPSDTIGPVGKHLGKALPSSFDWRDIGGRSYIGPIRDQGYCGSCYAFGACAAAEGTFNWAYDRYDSNCVDFSEAHVAFCLSDYYSGFDGCSGASYDYEELDALLEYGVYMEDAYPYQDHEQACPWATLPPASETTIFNAWHRIPCDDIDAIKTAIMTYGVVDMAVYVGSAFQAYSGGIYEDSWVSCDSSPCYYTAVNHAIALVGWNDNGDPENEGYWILRNSWGTSWGENGYMRIKYRSARVACEGTYLVLETEGCVEDDSGVLDLKGGVYPPGGEANVVVRVQGAPNVADSLGLEVVFDASALTYSGFTKGTLVEGWSFFDVTNPEPGIVRIGGFTTANEIAAAASGDLVILAFDVIDCEQGSKYKMELQQLKNDIQSWSVSQGCYDCGCSCDVNGDGDVTPGDALCAFQKYLGVCPTNCGPCDEVCCDVNMDSDCTPGDALEIFKEYLGLPSECTP